MRAKIQASNLITRLTKIAEGEVTGDGLSVQVTAALGLLKKILPDLSATTLASDPDRPFIQRIERVIVDPPNSNSEGVPPAT